MTSVDELIRLYREYPFVEWGVLYSATQEGQGRYPSMRWVDDLSKMIDSRREGEPKPRFALHVCGRAVEEFLRGEGHVFQVARRFGRVQLNFTAAKPSWSNLVAEACKRHFSIITQHNAANESLSLSLQKQPNHAVLFDASGGRGIAPLSWPAAFEWAKPCGYAGGLGPETLEREIPRIHTAARGRAYWIDMESKLRDEQDRFDLQRAEHCLRIVESFKTSPTALRTESTAVEHHEPEPMI